MLVITFVESALLPLLILGIASGMISLTVTKAKIFLWLRNFLTRIPFLHSLFTCPFCFSFYVCAGFMYLYQPLLIDTDIHQTVNIVFNYFVTWLIMIFIAVSVAGFYFNYLKIN